MSNVALRCRRACVFAAVACQFLAAKQLRADSSDVDELQLGKATVYMQLSAGNPVLEETPFAIYAAATASAPGAILGGNLRLPSGVSLPLLPDDEITFSLVKNFDTLSQLNAAFPDGTYLFDLQTSTPPTAFSSSMQLAQRFPSAVPKLLNTEWYSVVLQVDTRKPVTFHWNNFSGASADPTHPSGVELQISDIDGNIVYDQEFDPTATSATIPAGSTPGFYIGRLAFTNFDESQTSSVLLTGFSFAMTEFIISAINGPPAITSPADITVNKGQLFIYTVNATNGPGQFAANPLPPGTLFDANYGVLGGYPSTAGTYRVNISASNSIGAATAALTVRVQPSSALAITSSTRAVGSVGAPFRFQVLAPGASTAARLTASGLPAGLSVDAASGKIFGTPKTAGDYVVRLHVADGGSSADGLLLLTLNADPAFPGIRSATSATLVPGQKFTYKIDAKVPAKRSQAEVGTTTVTDETKYSYIGQLPTGLTFDSKTGTISGTFGGNAARGGQPGQTPLSGGALVGNVQLVASNSRGTSTVPLVFFSSPVGAVNISTRMAIASGDNVLIGGFIVTGNAPKKLLVRAVGPSLPVPGALQDPMLEIHAGKTVLATNDSWKSGDAQAVIDSGVPPGDDREAAIVAAFQPGNYTAVVRGKNGATGVALVELYDLGTASIDASSDAKLANISTRGLVQTGDNVMIGGFIISQVQSKVIVRAIGPSLAKAGVAGALPDTILELHGANGQIIASNDDWQTTQAQAIKDTKVPPTDPHESAIVATLNPGSYTAVVRGKNNKTGVALVEVYALQ